jgi:hypothetical protein
MQPNDLSPAQSAPRSSDETLEIELTAEEQLWLSRAGNAAAEGTSCADNPASHSPRPVGDNSLWMRTARVDAICTVTFAVVVLCIVAASLQHAAVPRAGTLAATPGAPVPPLSAASEPQRPPVQVKNPFDRSELFELPADTTEDQAREAVAELLLERARSRLHNPPAASTRFTRQRVVGATRGPTEIFVTQVSTTFK